ncbi:MAG: hypothetical protein BM555_07020 [Crocinitomix sp. MedPE-SWsnd]|nr:MAG: hypothetical protein BM555_07020 [Crocinitomix sp. MedPE-SWsnd]
MIVIFKYFVPKGYKAMTVFPFIFAKNKVCKEDMVLINHERIHIRQQIELLIIPFYLWYGLEFLIHFVRLKDKRKAYRAISFEKEAYGKESDLNYLKKRRFWNFLAFFK